MAIAFIAIAQAGNSLGTANFGEFWASGQLLAPSKSPYDSETVRRLEQFEGRMVRPSAAQTEYVCLAIADCRRLKSGAGFMKTTFESAAAYEALAFRRRSFANPD